MQTTVVEADAPITQQEMLENAGRVLIDQAAVLEEVHDGLVAYIMMGPEGIQAVFVGRCAQWSTPAFQWHTGLILLPTVHWFRWRKDAPVICIPGALPMPWSQPLCISYEVRHVMAHYHAARARGQDLLIVGNAPFWYWLNHQDGDILSLGDMIEAYDAEAWLQLLTEQIAPNLMEKLAAHAGELVLISRLTEESWQLSLARATGEPPMWDAHLGAIIPSKFSVYSSSEGPAPLCCETPLLLSVANAFTLDSDADAVPEGALEIIVLGDAMVMEYVDSVLEIAEHDAFYQMLELVNEGLQEQE